MAVRPLAALRSLLTLGAGKAAPPGRGGNRLSDVPILEAMAAACGYVAVMALDINSPAIGQLYPPPSGGGLFASPFWSGSAEFSC